ncbi:hypothetical protein JB92DRAFT_2928232 [Gautieria morchelliformis]|nr:hypothetical protein JB92DRAFT_2928232 [Gautieria morchelliformis]
MFSCCAAVLLRFPSGLLGLPRPAPEGNCQPDYCVHWSVLSSISNNNWSRRGQLSAQIIAYLSMLLRPLPRVFASFLGDSGL